MRRKYFKMLEQEGEAVPEKETNTKSGNVSGDEAQIENDKKSDNRELEDDLDEEGDFFKTDTKEKKKEAPNPVKKQTEKKPFTHTDRLKLIKERKKNQREEYENRQKNKLKEKEEKESLRIKHKKQMNQFTKKGQPKMGPRINRLLDQIKEL